MATIDEIDSYIDDILNIPCLKKRGKKRKEIITPEDDAKAFRKLQKILKKTEPKEKTKPKVTLGHNCKLDNEEKEFCDNISKITYHNVLSNEDCMHDVAVPPDKEYTPLVEMEGQPAKKYLFELDTFQKQANQCIDNNESVLVSAHTSAGKTVVAEYAIAKCLKNNQKVIYTTPIKALSNQKYRDFCIEFEDVGLITGDTTINPSASCLVMTTEILRVMLYEGSDVTREVGWVIFDEIHYMRDKERGYVWEESIILLSMSVKFVFLSATIPNGRQFSEWICFVHSHPCHVVYTEKRPTPLEHCLFPANTDDVYLIVDKKGEFKENNFTTAISLLQKGSETIDTTNSTGKAKSFGSFNCMKLVNKVIKKEHEPIIVFSFSKKECELYAKQASKLTLTNKDEEQLINPVISNALDMLSEENRKLPSIQSYIPYLRKGIGVHHGGLLPILKELTEILFGEGLVKVLFATETFSMGLNMPARTVIFTSLQKFDGKIHRTITPGEYIQMSGRAGRRGKDDKGLVVMIVDENINTTVVKNLFKGKADPMNSAFHLTYNMVLNMLRLESMNPEYILRRSFFQFQNYASLPDILKEINECRKQKRKQKSKDKVNVEKYYLLSEELKNLYINRHNYMIVCKRFIQFLMYGRLIQVIHNGLNFGWCSVLKKDPENAADLEDKSCNLDVLMKVAPDCVNAKDCYFIHNVDQLHPTKVATEWFPVITSIPHTSVWEICTRIVKPPKNLNTTSNKRIGIRLIDEFLATFAGDSRQCLKLDPVEHLFMKDPQFISVLNEIEKVKLKLEASPIHTSADRDDLLEKGKHIYEINIKLESLTGKFEEVKGIVQMNELKNKKRVLRRLHFITEDDVLTKKGSLACQITAANELLLVEMFFDAHFNDLSPSECCSLLSTFVCTDKGDKVPKMNYKLTMGLTQLRDTARRIAKELWFCKLDENEDAYVEQFQPYLMEVVFNWCNGRSFTRICKEDTKIYAGNIIRSMKRLEVLLRQMTSAAASVGLENLEKTFNESILLLKRDIVATDSLYI